MAKAPRKLPKAEMGTPDRARCGKGVEHIHQRTADRREDFAHKLSRQLVNEYGVIALEKLNAVNLLQNHRLVRYISDGAWSQLIQSLTNKAGYTDREVVLVDPRSNPQRCNWYGILVEKGFSVGVHKCSVSGLEIDRDEYADIIISPLRLQRLAIIPRSHPVHGIE